MPGRRSQVQCWDAGLPAARQLGPLGSGSRFVLLRTGLCGGERCGIDPSANISRRLYAPGATGTTMTITTGTARITRPIAREAGTGSRSRWFHGWLIAWRVSSPTSCGRSAAGGQAACPLWSDRLVRTIGTSSCSPVHSSRRALPLNLPVSDRRSRNQGDKDAGCASWSVAHVRIPDGGEATFVDLAGCLRLPVTRAASLL